MKKRLFDVSLSCLGLLILLPVLLAIMLVIKFDDNGPIFFRQERVGRRERIFRIWKFRSMVVGADRLGPSITQSDDHRVTRVGRFLRKSKLDELPQLLNVLAGDMSLVGPRPEVARYVAMYTAEERRVLNLTPGITDVASLEFRNEERLLGQADDAETFYREYCIPRKIALNLEYSSHASIYADVKIILLTLWAMMRS